MDIADRPHKAQNLKIKLRSFLSLETASARTGRVKENREPRPRAGAPRRRGDPGVQEWSTALFLRAGQFLHNRRFDNY